MSKKAKPDWTLQHHDGVSERTMIGRPVKPRDMANAERIALADDHGGLSDLYGPGAQDQSPFARFPGDDQAIVLPQIVQEHTLEVSAWVDGRLVGHTIEKEDTHYPDDGVPYVYDGRAAVVKALRQVADGIEAAVPAGDIL